MTTKLCICAFLNPNGIMHNATRDANARDELSGRLNLCIMPATVSRMASDTPPAPLSHGDMLRLWPRRKELVEGLAAIAAPSLPVVYPSVQSWETRDSIPPKYWPIVVYHAMQSGFGHLITPATLQAAADAKPRPPDRRRKPKQDAAEPHP